VEQKIKMLQLKDCPVCRKKEFETFLKTKDYFLTQEPFELVKCQDCDFVFTNPIPELNELSRYYDSPDYLSHTANKKSLTAGVYSYLRNRNLKNKYGMIQRFKSSGYALDIGQGTGEFLHFLKNRGWETTGIEPNESARKFAEKTYRLDVHEEDKLNQLNEDTFDLITLWHVLEHVPDLQGRMKQIRRLIKNDGLVFIAVPNLDSPDFSYYLDKWAALDVPRHLYHFTTKTMSTLLTLTGFTLKKTFPLKMDAYYVSLLSEKYKNNKLPYFKAFYKGNWSNRTARKQNNYSSMVFVAQVG
jgi:2-polyprenyl-3-methyl-5-hydroxy-6-metoxy-1,4-benzoquinol methylase